MQCAYSKLFILLFMYLFAGGGRRFNLILHIHKPLAGKHRAISLFIPHNNSTMGARGDSSKLFFYVSFLLKDFH